MFEKDQIVKFKDAGGTAKVSRIDGDTIYVIDDFGFENAHQAHELLPMVQWQVGAVEHKDKRREKSAPAAQQIDPSIRGLALSRIIGINKRNDSI